MIADGTGYIPACLRDTGMDGVPRSWSRLLPGGIGMPALQAMLSRQVDEERQGVPQGSLAALTSLTSIVGPLPSRRSMRASITTWNGGHGLRALPLLNSAGAACRRLSGAGNEPIADRGL